MGHDKSGVYIQEEESISYVNVCDLLNQFGDNFNPRLSDELDIELYARKLADHAHFLLCYDNDALVGFTAYYKNKNIAQLYVTLVCVNRQYQRKGLGQLMFNHLSDLSDKGWNSIGLEVNKSNIKGLNFYIKQHFLIQEDRGQKYLMIKKI